MNNQVEELRKNIIEMATLVERILQESMSSQMSLKEIFLIEDEINTYHKTIDDNVFKYIALQSPAARNLRNALAIMKMNSELERMGDQAVNIKRYFKKIKTSHALIENLSEEVTQMVKKSFNAFTSRDLTLAMDVIKSDEEVNSLHRDIIKDYIRKIKDEVISFDEGFSVIRVAKNLERIGDHATNVCEDIIFLESGADIRHGNHE
ncbi:MAG: phosphate transport system regulatory protein PhoU [Halobacteriovorax sp.]|nr:phosphate transport system regulatory protein PhoU [Halobacteriovorax sp.]MEE3079236.1 phosphate signaling complex protein PhoU [Bdellovibrionota bacterium]